MKTKLPWIGGALAVLLLGGFGVTRLVNGGSHNAGAGRASRSSDSRSAVGAGTSNPLPGSASTTNGSASTPKKKKSGRFKDCSRRIAYSKLGGEPTTQQYIRAQPKFQSEWGKGCWFLHAGLRCRVPWDLAYSVPSGDAYLRFQEWAHGAKTVTSEVEIGPINGNNSLHDVGQLFAIPHADSVAFRIVLENDKRIPVAISDSYIYPIDCATASH